MLSEKNEYIDFLNIQKNKIFKNNTGIKTNLLRVSLYTEKVDHLIQQIYALLIDKDGTDKDICLIALGSYGRKQLCPYSDIDILILVNPKKNEEKIERIVRFFWDLGLHLGCVVRTVQECVRILGEELATDTAFLDCRLIAGNSHLFSKLLDIAILPYFKRKKNKFISEMRKILFARIFTPTNSIFRIEPDIKNGICTLRDCHRIFWSEQIRTKTKTFEDLCTLSNFNTFYVDRFKQAYDFLIGLRIEMHLFCNRRMDVLENSFQHTIAERLEFTDASHLIEKFFRSVKDIKVFISAFIEKNPGGEGFFRNFRRKFASVRINNNIYALDGIFYPDISRIKSYQLTPIIILQYFLTSLRFEAIFSHDLCNIIRKATEKFTVKEFVSKEIYMIFQQILSHENPGQTLVLMLETGVLEKIIPEFQPLICKVEYDTYHEYPVDQHTILTFAALDTLKEAGDYELFLIFKGLREKFILRLSLLLHDIGKSVPGDHCKNGAIIAAQICNRMGLSEREIKRIQFLIKNHLLLSEFSFTREFEKDIIQDLAYKVKNKTNLDLLYLLTILDIKNVGSKTWTEWKGVQLRELYEKTMAALMEKTNSSEDAISENSKNYFSDYFDADITIHNEWLSTFRDCTNQQTIHLYSDEYIGFVRMTVIGRDRKDFFSDIVGCFSSEGYNILSAKVYSSKDGIVLDIFDLEPDTATIVDIQNRKRNILKKWKQINQGLITTETLIQERLQQYPQKNSDRVNSKTSFISIDNEKSRQFTVLAVSTKNRFGLLFKISQVFHDLEINIVSAKLSTRVDRAVDVFYITDNNHHKIYSQQVLTSLETKLRSALASML